MFRKTCATSCRSHGAETAEEIIGVLMAISVISKRLAKKLALLNQRPVGKEGGRPYGKGTVPTHAD